MSAGRSINVRSADQGRSCLHGAAGFTLIELMIATVLAIFVMGSVVVVQTTATESFEGAVAEQRLTAGMRAGISLIKEELRSVRADSVVVADINLEGIVDNVPLISFQQAVSFDVSTGQTIWGAGPIANGTVEYVFQGEHLVRQVRDEWGELVPAENRCIHRNLDRSHPVIPPVIFEWDPADGYITMNTRTRSIIGNKPVTREIDTVVHLESLFVY